ncbi:reverse transcriptase domain-containing protein [Sporosarcina ureae]|uniref:reverse transcriptase domain-containing protein n=1 Tax=Sporosarcina ureae TaxID=1571 RepID=UPI00300230E8
MRLLGIPTVTDRLIQQVIAHELTSLYDPTFSIHSFGFRTNRCASDVIRRAKGYIQGGNRRVVDMDLENFLDMVNHYRFTRTLVKQIEDKRLLGPIRSRLKSGTIYKWSGDNKCIRNSTRRTS